MSETETILSQRKELEQENKRHRESLALCRRQIRDYERRIEAIQLVMRNTKSLISANNDNFFELGKRLEK